MVPDMRISPFLTLSLTFATGVPCLVIILVMVAFFTAITSPKTSVFSFVSGCIPSSRYTVSPELDKISIQSLNNNKCKKEAIIYGKIPLMKMNYCLLGKSNRCYPNCAVMCQKSEKRFYLKDRLNMNFDILPDNTQTVTTIFNSKTLSILPEDLYIDSIRIDVSYEDIDKINEIIKTVKSGGRFEGKEFTNGNLNRQI